MTKNQLFQCGCGFCQNIIIERGYDMTDYKLESKKSFEEGYKRWRIFCKLMKEYPKASYEELTKRTNKILNMGGYEMGDEKMCEYTSKRVTWPCSCSTCQKEYELNFITGLVNGFIFAILAWGIIAVVFYVFHIHK